MTRMSIVLATTVVYLLAGMNKVRAQTNVDAAIMSQAKELLPVSEGLAVIGVKGDEEHYKRGYMKYGFINGDKKVVIPIKYDYALSFSEGLAVVGICEWLPSGGNSWRCGFIDHRGEIIIPIRLDWANSFSNGWAAARLNRKWGFIDKAGKWAIEPQFDDLANFSENLAPACLREKWGYIDRKGAFVIKPQFDYAFGFHEGKAKVLMRDPSYIGSGDGVLTGGLHGVIDKSGQFIEKPAK